MTRLVVFLGLCIAQLALGAMWTLTNADFQQRDGTLEYLSASGVGLTQSTLHEFAWAQIVSIEQRDVRSIKSKDAYVLYTRDGQKLFGAPESIGDEKLSWTSAMLGQFQIPLEEVRSFGRAGAAMPADATNEDRVILQNGDVLTGVVEKGEKGLIVQKGNASTPVAWDAVGAVSLAQIGEARPAASGLRIRLADGSVCIASTVHMDRDELRIERAGAQELKLPLRVVQSVQNERGRVRFLAWMEPASQQYTPYTSFTSDKGGGVKVLDEVSAAGRVFRNVVQIRPRCRVTYKSPVNGTLHLQYACGNAGQFTDMSLKISAGDKVVLDVPSVKSAQPSSAVDAPVNEGDVIHIDVGYGANYDVQDFLWLLDAAFVSGDRLR